MCHVTSDSASPITGTGQGMPILGLRSSTRNLLSTGKWVFCNGTDRQLPTTHDVETELAQRADSVKMHYKVYQNHCTYLL